jgi:hypothetical protein
MSGIHLYKAIMIGSLLNNNTRIAMTTSLHTVRLSTSSWKLPNGIQAPTYTNAATLKSKSITEEKTDSSVWRLKNPSQANAVPHEKAAKRSSEPRRVVKPCEKVCISGRTRT